MTAKTKLAQKRFALLQLVEKFGNVSKACRMHKAFRSQFYEYKRSFQEHGLEGLIDKSSIPGSHPSESLGVKSHKTIFFLSVSVLCLKKCRRICKTCILHILNPVPMCLPRKCFRCVQGFLIN
jgi:hypothetical protein